jgi:hypothetical protein
MANKIFFPTVHLKYSTVLVAKDKTKKTQVYMIRNFLLSI